MLKQNCVGKKKVFFSDFKTTSDFLTYVHTHGFYPGCNNGEMAWPNFSRIEFIKKYVYIAFPSEIFPATPTFKEKAFVSSLYHFA